MERRSWWLTMSRDREIEGGIFTRLVYIPETVSSDKKAIEYLKENPLDHIILDMVMPEGINGWNTCSGQQFLSCFPS
jgi:CheY-like chemotaxis protein